MFVIEKLAKFKRLYNLDVDDANSCFMVILKCLQAFGFYPLPDSSWWYKLYGWLVFFLLILPFPIGQCLHVYNNYGTGVGLVHLIALNGMIFEIGIVSFKVLYMRNNMYKVNILIGQLNNKILRSRTEEQKKISKQARNLILYIALIFLISSFVFCAFACLLPIVLHEDGLPLDINFPFINVLENPYFTIFFIWEYVSLMFLAASSAGYDLLAAASLLWIGCKLDLIANNLDHMGVPPNSQDVLNPTEEELRPIYETLRMCIRSHKLLKDMVRDFQEIFNPMFLVIFSTTAITFSILLYELTVPESNAKIFYIMYYYILISDILCYCYTGNVVSDKSNALTFNAINCAWFVWSQEKKKEYLCFLTHLHEPIQITAANLFPLSLSSFVSVLKTSYSYCAALHSIRNKK